jgi:hypothetical protein
MDEDRKIAKEEEVGRAADEPMGDDEFEEIEELEELEEADEEMEEK